MAAVRIAQVRQRCVLRTPDEMTRQIIAAWSEDRFPMVVGDLLGLPGTGAILAEGAALLPQQVARDILRAEYVRREAEQRGLKVIHVDAQTVAGVADKVEQHFAPVLEVLAPENQ